MLPLIKFIAVLATGIFSGAAIYINLVEHPARMSCSTEIAAAVWGPSYRRATVMQASLAIAGSLAGLAAWILGAGLMWLVAALCIFAVVPVTFIIIFPTNKKLLAAERDPGSPETRRLLSKWARLHAIRSALSLTASSIFVWQLIYT
jgi:uncharacterized membrane protein